MTARLASFSRRLREPDLQVRMPSLQRALNVPRSLLPHFDGSLPEATRAELESGLEALEGALAVRPADGELLALRGRVHALLGRKRRAASDLERAARLRRSPESIGWLALFRSPDEDGRALELLDEGRRRFPRSQWLRLWWAASRLRERPDGVLEALPLPWKGPAEPLARALRGRALQLSGRYREAAEEFGLAWAAERGSPGFLFLRGTALWHQGRHDDARRDHEASISARGGADLEGLRALLKLGVEGERTPELRLRIARALLEHLEDPLGSLSEAAWIPPRSRLRDEALRLRIKCFMWLGDEAGAAPCVDELLSSHPRDAELHLLRGRLSRTLDTHQRALEDLDRALRLDPTLSDAHSQRAENLGGMGDYPGAVRALDRAIALAPRHGSYYGWRGAAYARMGRPREARRDLLRSIRLSPRFARSRLWLGDLELRLGRPDRALVHLDRAVALDPNEEWCYAKRAQARRQAGDLKGAIEDLNAAVRYNSRYTWSYDNRPGHRAGEKGKTYRDGLGELDLAVRRHPRYAWARAWRGETKLGLDDVAGAERDLRAALALDPACAWAHVWLGELLRRKGRIGEALRSFDRGLRLDPGYVRGRLGRGAALVLAGRPAEALPDLDEAMRFHFVQAASWMSRALDALGRPEEALRCLEETPWIGSETYCTWQRGLLRLRLGRLEEGRGDLAEVAKRDPRFAELLAEAVGAGAAPGGPPRPGDSPDPRPGPPAAGPRPERPPRTP